MKLTAWQQPVWDSLRQRLVRERLPHAILLAGAAGLGKRALAAHLTAAALCRQAVNGEPCGACHGCQLLAAGHHPDLHPLALELNTKGKLRKEIVVHQVREMSRHLAMTSQMGGRQIAVIDPADRMNHAAANALLKTLEEPARDTVLVLLADQPWRLPATVRSRCQAFVLPLPGRDVALRWLRDQGVGRPDQALAAAGGNPGLAQRWHADGRLALHAEVEQDLKALVASDATVQAVSARWNDEQAAQRLWFAARSAADDLKQRAAGGAGGLGSRLGDVALLGWYRQVVKAREDLNGPLRPALVLFPLLAAWH